MSTGSQEARARHAMRRYVLEGERIALATRHHWARMLEPILTTIGTFIAVALLVEIVARGIGDDADVLWLVWLIPLGRLVRRVIEWRVEWFVATDKRMLRHTGIITHKVAMMPMRSVTDLSYTRSLLGQVLGYGEFVLESAGQDQPMSRIPWMPHPDVHYRMVCAMLFGPATPEGAPERPAQGGVVVVPRRGTRLGARRGWSALPDSEITQQIPLRPFRVADPSAAPVPEPWWDLSKADRAALPFELPATQWSDEDRGGSLT